MWIIDLEQMLDQAVAKPELPDLKEKVKKLGYLVNHATSIEAGISTESKPACRRQSSNHPCNGVLEICLLSTKKQDDVLISGFGKFSVREKKERKGRNPATGDSLMI